MAIVNMGTGELHVLKDTGIVNTAKTVEGQVAVVADGAPNLYDGAAGIAAGAKIDGFALHDAVAGEAFTIVKSGFMVVLAGAATATDLELQVDGTGRVIAAAAGDYVVGKSKTAAAAAGDEMLIELYQSGYLI